MASVLTTLQLQVMCQLVMPGGSSFENTSTAVNTSTSPIKPVTLPPGYIAYPEMNAAYKFSGELVSWTEARKRCVSEGAQLPVIDTQKKLKFIKGHKSGFSYVHVGIHSFFNENEWVSVKDGAPVSTPQWESGYPKNDGRCVLLAISTAGLQNYGCTAIWSYVCELPIPKP